MSVRWFMLSAACVAVTSGAFWLLTDLASPDSGWADLGPVIFVPWGLSLIATALLLLKGACFALAPPLRAIARWADGPQAPRGRGTHMLPPVMVPPGFVPPSAVIAAPQERVVAWVHLGNTAPSRRVGTTGWSASGMGPPPSARAVDVPGELLGHFFLPVAGPCAHPGAVPVELLLTGEIVAWLCPGCDQSLPSEWAAP